MLTENAINILKRRYLKKDEMGNVIETPEELFKRVSMAVAKADLIYNEDYQKSYEKFYNLLSNLEFLPNSPTLMNAGRKLGMLSACFVLPIEDSIEGIFETLKNTAIIHKSGGGTGFNFSNIRSKGSYVKTTSGIASGPVSFMGAYNCATEVVKQGGMRKGANIAILNINHPDIIDFIECKKEERELQNFNISVAITDSFMDAYFKDREYDLIEPSTKNKVKSIRAKGVFDSIVENAWLNGEPGVLFIDTINKYNTLPSLGQIEATNPCGEVPLFPYEACNLGSINLTKCIRDNKIDYEKLKYIVHEAVHFLDNVIDINKYPLREIERMAKGTRKIGLGVMGYADMLIMLGIPYESHEALTLGEKLMNFISTESKSASEYLGKKRGTFEFYDKSIYKKNSIVMRNATTTTIAPTGTISIIAGVSSGIEPIFGLSYSRTTWDGEDLLVINPYLEEILTKNGLFENGVVKEILNTGSVNGIIELSKEIKFLFKTAYDIDYKQHIFMQSVFQKYTDNAISKTINLSKETNKTDVKAAFILAYRLGCKGITIYRDKSRQSQVINK